MKRSAGVQLSPRVPSRVQGRLENSGPRPASQQDLRPCRDQAAERAPNLLDRDFVASAPNRCWIADFTHVATWNGWRHAISEPARGRQGALRARADRHPGRYGCRPSVWGSIQQVRGMVGRAEGIEKAVTNVVCSGWRPARAHCRADDRYREAQQRGRRDRRGLPLRGPDRLSPACPGISRAPWRRR